MATIHKWRSQASQCINHTLRSREVSQRIPSFPSPRRCRLIMMVDFNGDFQFDLPCFACSGCHSLDLYFQLCELELHFHLRSRFPSLHDCCTSKIFDTFKQIVKCAGVTHRCPRLCNVNFATTHVVQIDLVLANAVPVPVPVLDRVIQESFQEVAFVRPATKDSVRALFMARDDSGDDKTDLFDSCDQCVICFEEMETRKTTLTMPCSHVFHQDCLVQWLNNRNYCPLCRFEMPEAINH